MRERERARRAGPPVRRAAPSHADPRIARLLALQQAAGNRAVARMFVPSLEDEQAEATKEPSPWTLGDYLNPRFYLPEAIGGYSEREVGLRGNPEPNFGIDDFPPECVALFKRAFLVVDSAADRKRPDDLTRDEYDETATLLGQIWVGATAMVIDPNAVEEGNTDRDVKIAVLKDVIEVARTATGRALLGTVAQAAGTVPAVRVTIHAVDAVVPPTAGARDTKLDVRQRQAAEVTYTPTEFKAGRAEHAQANIDKNEALKQHNPWIMPRRSDISLYHELVHAFHLQAGRTKAKDQLVGSRHAPAVDAVDAPFQEQSKFGGTVTSGVAEEEYFTVGLGVYSNARFSENKYRRERRDLGEDVPDRPYYTVKDQHGQRLRENVPM